MKQEREKMANICLEIAYKLNKKEYIDYYLR